MRNTVNGLIRCIKAEFQAERYCEYEYSIYMYLETVLYKQFAKGENIITLNVPRDFEYQLS